MWIKSIKNTFHWIQACFGVHTLHKSLISLLKRFSSFMDSFRVKIVYTRSISLFENFPRIMIKKCEKHLILEIFYLREKTFFSSHFWSAHQIMLEHPPSFFSFEAYLSCGLWGHERSFVSFPSFLAIFAFFSKNPTCHQWRTLFTGRWLILCLRGSRFPLLMILFEINVQIYFLNKKTQ